MASESKSEAWKEKAAAKRTATLSKIRAEWRLSSDDMDRAKQQLNLSGPFMQQFLDDTEISITQLDSVPLVEAIKSREYTAVQVATAFCHRAAVAHQIVGNISVETFLIWEYQLQKSLWSSANIVADPPYHTRTIVSLRSSLIKP